MVEDTPDDLVFELHNEAMWGSHPYGYSILGTRDTVAALGVPELRELHARAYHPAQVVVAAAGNVEHDALLAALERAGWNAVPGGDAAPLPAPVAATAPPAERVLERDGSQTHIVFGSPVVPHGDPRRYAVVLVDMLLGGGMSSRLFQRIREELGLAYSVYSFQNFHPDAGTHGIYVGTSPDTAAAAREAIVAELARLAADGLGAEEVAVGKSQLKGQVTMSLESVTSRMYRAASVALYDEPFRSLDEVLSLIDAITEDELRSVCAEFFSPERQTVVTLGPGRAGSTR